MKGYEEELEMELDGEALSSGRNWKEYKARELDVSRKNITQKYMRLLRLVYRLVTPTAAERRSEERLKTLMSRSVPSISTVMKIYRDPAFAFFVTFLKN